MQFIFIPPPRKDGKPPPKVAPFYGIFCVLAVLISGAFIFEMLPLHIAGPALACCVGWLCWYEIRFGKGFKKVARLERPLLFVNIVASLGVTIGIVYFIIIR